MKLRLVRLNPLIAEPGAHYLMGARQLDGLRIDTFPVRLECWDEQTVTERTAEHPYGLENWQPVEFVNEFLTDKDYNTREVRSEVQVPVYHEPAKRTSDGGKTEGSK